MSGAERELKTGHLIRVKRGVPRRNIGAESIWPGLRGCITAVHGWRPASPYLVRFMAGAQDYMRADEIEFDHRLIITRDQASRVVGEFQRTLQQYHEKAGFKPYSELWLRRMYDPADWLEDVDETGFATLEHMGLDVDKPDAWPSQVETSSASFLATYYRRDYVTIDEIGMLADALRHRLLIDWKALRLDPYAGAGVARLGYPQAWMTELEEAAVAIVTGAGIRVEREGVESRVV